MTRISLKIPNSDTNKIDFEFGQNFKMTVISLIENTDFEQNFSMTMIFLIRNTEFRKISK